MEDMLICLIKVPLICLFFLSIDVFLWKQVTMSQRLAESVEEMPCFGAECQHFFILVSCLL
jgi:hypothetical protein